MVQDKLDRVNEVTLNILERFGTIYTKWYMRELLVEIKEEFNEELRSEDENSFMLSQVGEVEKLPLKAGWVEKAGKNGGRIKRRWVVVHDKYQNWDVEYFTDDSLSKQKGTMKLAGYNAPRRMTVDEMKDYGENWIIITHPDEEKRVWKIMCDDDADVDGWLSVLGACTKEAQAIDTSDPCAERAFKKAIWELRQELHIRGGTTSSSETDQLEAVIRCELEAQVLNEAYEDVRGSPSNMITRKIADYKVKGAKTMVKSIITKSTETVWGRVQSTIADNKLAWKNALRENLDPIVTLQEEVKNATQSKMEEIARPIIQEKLNGEDGKFRELDERVSEAFECGFETIYAHGLWEMHKTRRDFCDLKQEFQSGRFHRHPFHIVWHAAKRISEAEASLESALSALGKKDVASQFRAPLFDMLMRILWTYQEQTNTGMESHEAFEFTVQALKNDAPLALTKAWSDFFEWMIMEKVHENMEPTVKNMAKSFEVPEALAPLIDPESMAIDVLNGVVRGICMDLAAGISSNSVAKLQDAMNNLKQQEEEVVAATIE